MPVDFVFQSFKIVMIFMLEKNYWKTVHEFLCYQLEALRPNALHMLCNAVQYAYAACSTDMIS